MTKVARGPSGFSHYFPLLCIVLIGRGRSRVLFVAGSVLLSACTMTTAALIPGQNSSPTRASAAQSISPKPVLLLHIWPGRNQPPAGFPWRPTAGSPYLAIADAPNKFVSLLWLDVAHLKIRYVPGFKYPEGSPRSTADMTPATWVPKMVAAFDGGFKLADHVGGYYYLGAMVAPLKPGLATIVVYKNGSVRVGRWGRDLHQTTDMLMIRQNMYPLVDQGVSQTKSSDTYRTWGFTFNHRWLVNRSALGVRADGTFVFIYGHNITPSTIADYLVQAGARFAIDLDMNGYFPAGFIYRHVGSSVIGSRINPHVVHFPAIYLVPYQKDFFSVQSL